MRVFSHSNCNEVRKVYLKGLRYCADKVKIGKDWHDWERLFGDAVSLIKCE